MCQKLLQSYEQVSLKSRKSGFHHPQQMITAQFAYHTAEQRQKKTIDSRRRNG
jgi:hypothetical protein